ncbi:GAF domain-containing protein [Paenibacillus graminis]|uniref:GAF domain-containing protein n=1 Tax=Paenibacillus graminis TaxID=189425 RepID=A0A089NCU0_9BACL|nr:GAF domain-containing protein [Paenibacillus graminis]AIQ66784.1 GAF domain-containing protein [Paenibacillus graminis]MEC0170113.1 GAF domain-containing protein [Paenibacillus graminis]
MFQAMPYDGTRSERYESVLSQLGALMEGEPNAIANLANASALLKTSLPDTNWAGFYLFDGKELVLGPFQGLPACIRIPLGKGVCGTAASERRTLVVGDVHAFPGHIACDEASNSEIVVPLIQGDRLLGVLDIDSPIKHRFDDEERRFLERFAGMVAEVIC